MQLAFIVILNESYIYCQADTSVLGKHISDIMDILHQWQYDDVKDRIKNDAPPEAVFAYGF